MSCTAWQASWRNLLSPQTLVVQFHAIGYSRRRYAMDKLTESGEFKNRRETLGYLGTDCISMDTRAMNFTRKGATKDTESRERRICDRRRRIPKPVLPIVVHMAFDYEGKIEKMTIAALDLQPLIGAIRTTVQNGAGQASG